MQRSRRSAVIPLVDQTKTTGLIAFPETMIGMLAAGAAPVRQQLVLLWVLLGGVSGAALVAVLLARRSFLTPAQQLPRCQVRVGRVSEAGDEPADRGLAPRGGRRHLTAL